MAGAPAGDLGGHTLPRALVTVLIVCSYAVFPAFFRPLLDGTAAVAGSAHVLALPVALVVLGLGLALAVAEQVELAAVAPAGVLVGLAGLVADVVGLLAGADGVVVLVGTENVLFLALSCRAVTTRVLKRLCHEFFLLPLIILLTWSPGSDPKAVSNIFVFTEISKI